MVAGFTNLINTFLPPSPRPPSPPGKGETKVILCKGLCPLHPRGLNPGGTGGWRLTRPEGGWRFWSPDCPADMVPKGGLPPRSPACPAFIVFPAPIPLSPFPAGRGRLLVYFAGGWRPRHPCTEPLTALNNHAIQATPRGAEPGRHWGVAAHAPEGGTMALVAGFTSLINTFLPPSPRPPSRREGGDF